MRKRAFAFLTILAVVCAVALAQYATSNYREQGGVRWVIGGSLDVATGGDLDVESGGALKIAGTAVTSTAAELNALDGITATVAELNILDGCTATSAELTIMHGVTATAAELNNLDGPVAGTASASKAAVLGANKDLDVLRVDMWLLTAGADSLTSPDTVVDVTGLSYVVVTTDVAQTGITLSGGVENQVVFIEGTHDTNTVQLDDGTSYTMQGNATLQDGWVLPLRCEGGNAYVQIAEIAEN